MEDRKPFMPPPPKELKKELPKVDVKQETEEKLEENFETTELNAEQVLVDGEEVLEKQKKQINWWIITTYCGVVLSFVLVVVFMFLLFI